MVTPSQAPDTEDTILVAKSEIEAKADAAYQGVKKPGSMPDCLYVSYIYEEDNWGGRYGTEPWNCTSHRRWQIPGPNP